MQKKEIYKEYFEEDSEEWIKMAYEEGHYEYPVGQRRLELLKRILYEDNLTGKNVLDIGCGGGDIALFLASRGAKVVAIDMSEKMLEIAIRRAEEKRVEIDFLKEDFMALSAEVTRNKYDLIIAYGLIGYLPSDADFFRTIAPLMRTHGTVIVSARNRLFNITSITPNTKKEIACGNAFRLIDEIDNCYNQQISMGQTRVILERIRRICDVLIEKIDNSVLNYDCEVINDRISATSDFQPRQSTPMGLKNEANKFGFNFETCYGIHPHLLLPRMNKMFPKQVFNMLSDSLIVLEEMDISRAFCSVIVEKFTYK